MYIYLANEYFHSMYLNHPLPPAERSGAERDDPTAQLRIRTPTRGLRRPRRPQQG